MSGVSTSSHKDIPTRPASRKDILIRPTSHNDILTRPTSQKDILAQREEEYKRLNDELEAKTASLVQEADKVMHGPERIVTSPKVLDNISPDDFLKHLEDDLNEKDDDLTYTEGGFNCAVASQSSTAKDKSCRPKSRKFQRSSSSSSRLSMWPEVDPDIFLTDLKEAGKSHDDACINDTKEVDNDDNGVVPHAAADEIGNDALIRVLKAKVRVMQEELDRTSLDNSRKEEEMLAMGVRVKQLEEERGRLHRTSAAHLSQLDKQRKLAEDFRHKSDSLEHQLTAVRKETNQMRRGKKQQQSSLSATEVRLNRALEEIERHKSHLSKTKVASKDAADEDKRRLEQLTSENRCLEKQKNELMSGFRKQMKLIDILKRQKMHIETAKMLQFSEEEFVRALELGS